jgi:dihydrofolate reductase
MPERELRVDLWISLDGFATGDAPAYFGYFGPELERQINADLDEARVMLMGRVTYEEMAEISASGAYEDATQMAGMPKVVFSNTLEEPLSWANTRLLSGDLETAVRGLKEEPGDDLRTIGSPTLVDGLLALGLVDRLRLVVFPLLLGDKGKVAIFDRAPNVHLELVGTKVLDSRLLLVEYAPRSDGQP